MHFTNCQHRLNRLIFPSDGVRKCLLLGDLTGSWTRPFVFSVVDHVNTFREVNLMYLSCSTCGWNRPVQQQQRFLNAKPGFFFEGLRTKWPIKTEFAKKPACNIPFADQTRSRVLYILQQQPCTKASHGVYISRQTVHWCREHLITSARS